MIFKTFDFVDNYLDEFGFPLIQLNIPNIESEHYKIENRRHQSGENLEIVTPRMAILTGRRLKKLKLENDWISTHLIERDKEGLVGEWMSNLPYETYTQLYPALNAHGHVLIGGLGLGYILVMMKVNPRIKSVTVVEKDKELLELLRGYYDTVKFELANIKTYLNDTDIKYDYIYLDTWINTVETEFYNNVLPLRQQALRCLKSNNKENVNCWMEEVMRGQVIEAIRGKVICRDLIQGMTPLRMSVGEEGKTVSVDLEHSGIIVQMFFEKHTEAFLNALSGKKLNKLIQDYVLDFEL